VIAAFDVGDSSFGKVVAAYTPVVKAINDANDAISNVYVNLARMRDVFH
jgi:hypothetical protein